MHAADEARVVLVDDHPIVLTGLRELLDGSRWYVVGEAMTGQTCLAEVSRARPDAVVLDLRLPDRLAPDVCRELRRAAPKTKAVVLTGFDDEALLSACLVEGATGILLKDARKLDLVSVLDRVQRGETVLDPRLDVSTDAHAVRGDAGLTVREHDVLRLVARGMTSADIAAELYLSVNTVRTYVQTILEKTGTHTRIEALGAARCMRLI